MALRYAVATGNWSAPATWDGGTLPAPGDVVRANGFTVTVNADVTGIELRNDASSPAVAGGLFLISGTRVIGANVFAAIANCVSIGSGANVAWAGNSTAGSASGAHGISMGNSAGTLVFSGNVTGGTFNNTIGLLVFNTSHTVTFSGNATGGTTSGAHGLQINSGNVTVSSGAVFTGGSSNGTFGVHVTGGTLTCSGCSLVSGSTTGTSNAALSSAGGSVNLTVTAYTQNAFGNCFRLTSGAPTINAAGITFSTPAGANSVFNIQGGRNTITAANAVNASGSAPIAAIGGNTRWIGNITGGSTSGTKVGASVTTTAIFIVDGDVTGGSDTAAHGILFINTSGAVLVINGNTNGGSVAGAHGVAMSTNTPNDVAIFNGVATGNAGNGINNTGSAKATLFGSVVNGAASGISNTGTGSITVVPIGGGGVSSPFAYAC